MEFNVSGKAGYKSSWKWKKRNFEKKKYMLNNILKKNCSWS